MTPAGDDRPYRKPDRDSVVMIYNGSRFVQGDPLSQRIAVIGGGAAGMMAAFSAASAGASVTVFERGHSPGAKILLTGGGRCNFTRESEPRDFVHDLGKRGRFMGHALAALPPSTTRKMFAGLGVPSIVEPDGRVVPVSQRAVDVRRALVDALASAGVRMVGGADVTAAAPCSDGWRLECSTPQTGSTASSLLPAACPAR